VSHRDNEVNDKKSVYEKKGIDSSSRSLSGEKVTSDIIPIAFDPTGGGVRSSAILSAV